LVLEKDPQGKSELFRFVLEERVWVFRPIVRESLPIYWL
jgi:hypothetical protein